MTRRNYAASNHSSTQLKLIPPSSISTSVAKSVRPSNTSWLASDMWQKVAQTTDILPESGGCVFIGGKQIAIFQIDAGREWFATQNLCPHTRVMALSRGLVGDTNNEPKVACPVHKNTFDLRTGKHLGGNEQFTLKTYPIKIDGTD